jgi:uncharacterized protein YbaA (DUF1428 family)
MPRYVDGFLLAIPKNKIALYRRMAQTAGKVWRAHGALEYRETVGDDLKVKKGMGLGFASAARTKPGEVPVFSWIVYKSKAHRKAVNSRVMKDPRIEKMMKAPMPFNPARMFYGGFKVIVDL